MTNQLTATYGHGTENDFVILFDADDQIEIKADHVAAICNRATGIGADGFIRIVKRNAKWLWITAMLTEVSPKCVAMEFE